MSAPGPRPPSPERAEVRPLLVDDGSYDGPPWIRLALATIATGLAAATAWILRDAGDRPAHLPLLIDRNLEDSGVSNPVTAVLLNFRGYDTLLEVAVLLAAMTGVWSLDRGSRQFGRPVDEPRSEPVIEALIRIVVPVAFLTAVYLTWIGSSAPGGAFQAASLLAGAGVLLTVAGLIRPPTAGSATVRAIAAGGLAGFVLAGMVVFPWTGAFLAYPPGWAYPMILAIEVVLTISIAVILVEVFVDVPAIPDPDPSLADVDPSGDPLGRALLIAAPEENGKSGGAKSRGDEPRNPEDRS